MMAIMDGGGGPGEEVHDFDDAYDIGGDVQPQ